MIFMVVVCVKRRVKFYAVSVFVACLFRMAPTTEQRAISEDIKILAQSAARVCLCVLLHIPCFFLCYLTLSPAIIPYSKHHKEEKMRILFCINK